MVNIEHGNVPGSSGGHNRKWKADFVVNIVDTYVAMRNEARRPVTKRRIADLMKLTARNASVIRAFILLRN